MQSSPVGPQFTRSSSPAEERPGLGRVRGGEEVARGAGLDEPAAVQEGDVVGEPAGLAEVVGAHHYVDAVAATSRDHRLDACVSRRGRGAAEGSSRKRHSRLERPGARHGEPLLLAAGEPPRRPGGKGFEAEAGERRLAPAPHERPGQAGEGERVLEVGPDRAAQASPGAGRPSPAPGRRARAAPRRRGPRVGAIRPWQRRSSRLLPAPFGPRTTSLRPARIVSDTPCRRRAPATAKPSPFEPERQDGGFLPHPIARRVHCPRP